MNQEIGNQNQDAANNVQEQEQDEESNQPFCFRWTIKILIVIVSIAAVVSSFFAIFTFKPLCIVAGIVITILALLVVFFELPFCCPIPFLGKIHAFVYRRPKWQKAAFYGAIGIVGIIVIPVFLCTSAGGIIAAAFIIVVAILNGVIAIGKK